MSFRRRSWNSWNIAGYVENRDQSRIIAKALAQALLIRTHALIAIDVEANGNSSILAELVDSFAEQAIIDWPSMRSNVVFPDANDCDWLCFA